MTRAQYILKTINEVQGIKFSANPQAGKMVQTKPVRVSKTSNPQPNMTHKQLRAKSLGMSAQ